MGLVDEVHLAAEVTEGPWPPPPATPVAEDSRAAKQHIDGGLDAGIDTGLLLERHAFQSLFATEDAAEGMASFVADGPGKATFRSR